MRTSYFARRFVPGCDAFALSTLCEKFQFLELLFPPGFEFQLDLHPAGGKGGYTIFEMGATCSEILKLYRSHTVFNVCVCVCVCV
jgi:hypothetical protein